MKFNILFAVIITILTSCSNNSYKTIVLKTIGFIEAEPNEASILVHLSCTNKNIEQAKSCLIKKSAELITDLEKSGIKKIDILTTRVDLSKDYVWINNSSVFNGYNASTSININVRDLVILDDLYTKLLGNSNIVLNSLTYHHNKIDSLNEIAYLRALDNANSLADKILSQLPENNKTITQVSNIKISSSNIDEIISSNEVDDFRAKRSSDKMTVNTGNMIVEQQLFVEFKIY